MEDYQSTNVKSFLGDTNTNDAIMVVITLVKRALHSSKTEDSLPTVYLVNALTKKTVNHERNKAMITGKLEEFEKSYEILLGL